jgi:hypothetical protein
VHLELGKGQLDRFLVGRIDRQEGQRQHPAHRRNTHRHAVRCLPAWRWMDRRPGHRCRERHRSRFDRTSGSPGNTLCHRQTVRLGSRRQWWDPAGSYIAGLTTRVAIAYEVPTAAADIARPARRLAGGTRRLCDGRARPDARECGSGHGAGNEAEIRASGMATAATASPGASTSR